MIYPFWKKIAQELTGIFLPDLCLLCDAPLEDQEPYVCTPCWISLPLFPDRTAQPFRSLRGLLDRLWIGWEYDGRVRRIVHLFKYESRPELARLLANEWLKAIAHPDDLRDFDLLLPVPIHRARRRWRGFNQSERLAIHLSQVLNLPVAVEEAVRIVNTPSQTLLDRDERWRSVAEAFRILQPETFRDKRILMVDDLATSGATLHALARRLHDCGAARVAAAVLTSPNTVDSQFQKYA